MRGCRLRSGLRLRALAAAYLLAQQVNEQVVVPAAVRPALVAAHHADGPKADRFIRANGARVGARGIDRDAVMPALLEQPPCGQPERRAPHAAALVIGSQEDVEAGVAAVGVILLVVAKPAREAAADLDREGLAVVEQPLALVLEIVLQTPPLAQAGRSEDLDERVEPRLRDRVQDDPGAAQKGRHASVFHAASGLPGGCRRPRRRAEGDRATRRGAASSD